jgi:hypothetical protein
MNHITIVEVPFRNLPGWVQTMVKAGFPWGCQCGEGHKTEESARNCHKCRSYLNFKPTEIYYTPLEEEANEPIQ